MSPAMIRRKAIARMSAANRATLNRLIDYRDSYAGKSGIERRDRERMVTEHIRRSA